MNRYGYTDFIAFKSQLIFNKYFDVRIFDFDAEQKKGKQHSGVQPKNLS